MRFRFEFRSEAKKCRSARFLGIVVLRIDVATKDPQHEVALIFPRNHRYVDIIDRWVKFLGVPKMTFGFGAEMLLGENGQKNKFICFGSETCLERFTYDSPPLAQQQYWKRAIMRMVAKAPVFVQQTVSIV